MAREEIGKVFLLADHWVSKQDLSPEEYKKIFRSGGAHARKLAAAGRAFLKAEAWQNMGDFFAEHDQESKEGSLYVDYQQSAGFGYWVGPVDYPDEQEEMMKRMEMDFKGMKQNFGKMEELDLSYQIRRSFSVIGSLRNFLEEQRKVLPGMRPPDQPVIVAPAREPPKIEVTDEFTVEYLLKMYEDCLTMLTRPDITQLPSSLPVGAPSLSWSVPYLERLQSDVRKIPSQKGKKAFVLYHLGLLRTNLGAEIHDKAQNLDHLKDYDQAIALMNEYATKVAIPFNGKESQLKRAVRVARNMRAGPFGPTINYPRQWKTRYRRWLRKNRSLDPDKRFRAYLDLDYTFSMLQGMSFSSDNFPKLDELTEDELNRFLVTGHFP